MSPEGKVPSKMQQLRIANNMTQKDLAELLRVDERTIRSWESGKSIPSAIHRTMITNEFFDGDPDSYSAFFGGSDCFSNEMQLLKKALAEGTILPVFSANILPLFDLTTMDTEISVICSVLGGAQSKPSVGYATFMEEIAIVMQKVTTAAPYLDRGETFHDLRLRLPALAMQATGIEDSLEITAKLDQAFLHNTSKMWLETYRYCFSFLYDNYAVLGNSASYFCALTDILDPLGGIGICAKDRRRLFYACLDLAKMISTASLKGGEDK